MNKMQAYDERNRVENETASLIIFFFAFSGLLSLMKWLVSSPSVMKGDSKVVHTQLKLKKAKAVPLHATEALRRKRSIAPTHRPRYWWGWVVSVTPRPRFTPRERTPGTHWTGGWVGLRAGLDTEARGKIFCHCRGSNPDRPVVQSVVRHYTAWANPAPK
jgi:hypothetical protein